MKIPTFFLLISLVIIFACQNTDQQVHKDDIASIDSTLDVTVVPIDSTLATTNDSNENTVLPDSVIITFTASTIGAETIVFSINHDKESSIEINPRMVTMSGKVILSRAYSDQILKRIGVIFLEHKTPVIIDKKYIPEEFVFSELPVIKFVIYSDDKTIETEYFIVGERQGHYEITYSNYFLRLYNLLYTKALALYELNR